MPFNLDAYLGIQPAALEVYTERAQVLGANLANADTPGYLARDIDFRAALAAAGSAESTLQPASTNPADLTAPSAPEAGVSTQQYLKYRVPLAPSLDGNTVDSQLEESKFAANTVRYEAALTILEDRFKELGTAITGT